MKFNNLLRETQFHGGRRLADKHFRWWWSVSLLLLFGAAGAVISVTIQRFLSNPTYIAQEEKLDRTMAFPSVLVCPEVMFLDWKIDKFLENIIIPPNLNRTYLKKTMNQLAAFFSPDVIYQTDDLENLEYLLEYNEMSLDTAGQLLTSTCEETLIRCRWLGNNVNCSKLFSMELTGDGYCCVFNGRSLKRKYENHKLETKYMSRLAGFTSGLLMAVNQSQKPNNVDLSYKWLALQTSQHFVETSINGTPLNPGSEQWAAFYIRSFQIEEEARSLSDQLKKCRMSVEPLEYFPVYYRRYCVLECEMRRTLKRCNCVRHIHPLPKGAMYCRAKSLLCATHAKVTYASEECNCPSGCDVATNYVKSSSFYLLPNAHYLDSFYEGLNFERVTIVRAYLNSRHVKVYSRCSYFNNYDVFAQIGGVFNLFFGCSILTILELAILGLYGLRGVIPRNIKTEPNKNTLNLKKKLTKKAGKTHKLKKQVKFVKSIS